MYTFYFHTFTMLEMYIHYSVSFTKQTLVFHSDMEYILLEGMSIYNSVNNYCLTNVLTKVKGLNPPHWTMDHNIIGILQPICIIYL